MINDIGNTLTKHKHIIMMTIAAAALVAYIVPFDNLMGVADAQYKTPPVKKDSFKKDFKKDFKTSIKIGATQSAVQNSGILSTGGSGGTYGGSTYDGLQVGNTAFNFLQQSQQICSGISNCPSTQTVQFTPYTFFGGP